MMIPIIIGVLIGIMIYLTNLLLKCSEEDEKSSPND